MMALATTQLAVGRAGFSKHISWSFFGRLLRHQRRLHHHPHRSLVLANGHRHSSFFVTKRSEVHLGTCNAHAPIDQAPNTSRWYCSSQPSAKSQSEKDVNPTEQSLERRQQSDPTAKRPTQKCDPYGLQGGSLSYGQCLDLKSTLEGGWRLLESEHDADDMAHSTTSETSPKFLQRQYFHSTFHEASQFLSHMALLATNINHFPYLSMERILVDDVNNIHGNGRDEDCNSEAGETKNRGRKVKGWVFRTTVRCSTYRPPTAAGATTPRGKDDKSDVHRDKGLTYHDFHLAMSCDVEANREEVKRLLWSGK